MKVYCYDKSEQSPLAYDGTSGWSESHANSLLSAASTHSIDGYILDSWFGVQADFEAQLDLAERLVNGGLDVVVKAGNLWNSNWSRLDKGNFKEIFTELFDLATKIIVKDEVDIGLGELDSEEVGVQEGIEDLIFASTAPFFVDKYSSKSVWTIVGEQLSDTNWHRALYTQYRARSQCVPRYYAMRGPDDVRQTYSWQDFYRVKAKLPSLEFLDVVRDNLGSDHVILQSFGKPSNNFWRLPTYEEVGAQLTSAKNRGFEAVWLYSLYDHKFSGGNPTLHGLLDTTFTARSVDGSDPVDAIAAFK